MAFTETVIWTNPAAAYGELNKLTHKPACAAGSRSLRSVTAWVDENPTTYVTRHLYLSDHHDRHSGVNTLRLRYFENRKYRDGRATNSLGSNGDLTDPAHGALLLGYGDQERAIQVLLALAAVIPPALLAYLPVAQLDALQRLLIVRFPLLRHLAEQGVTIPHAIPDRFVRLFEYPTTRDVLAGLVGPDQASRPAAAELGRLLVHDGQVRTREASLLLAARGLPRDVIASILRGTTPTGDGSAIVDPADGRAAARTLAQLGPDRHQQAIRDLLAREQGPAQVRAIAQRGDTQTDGVRTVDQLVERARRRGRYDHLNGLAVPGTNRRLQVIYPGEDAELTQLGTQMRNCIRQYVTGGGMPFTRGAIIAVVDQRGRAHHAIQIDGRGHVRFWEGPGNSPPPADRTHVERVLREHHIVIPRHQPLAIDEAPF